MAQKPLTDEEIRRQLKEIRGTLALLGTTLQGLEDQLDEREQARKLAAKTPANSTAVSTGAPAANNAAFKDPASKPVAVADVKPRNRYGFLLPRGLTGNFNSAKSLIESSAVPNYISETIKPQDLADFRTVVAALAAAPAQKANRSVIFLPDLRDYLPDYILKDMDADPSQREAMNIVQGKSKNGFNFAVLKARTPDNKPALLYVLQDTERQSMIVAGPDRISAGLKAQLAQGGIEYVVKGDKESIDQINTFIADGMKYRGERGMMSAGGTQIAIENLIKGFSAVCELAEPTGEAVTRGVTFGWVVHNSKSQPAVFTHITRAGANAAP